MKQFILPLMVVSTLLPATITTMVKPAAALNCNAIESFGTAFNGPLLNQINSNIAGSSSKISTLKTLKIKNVSYLDFKGCQVNLTTNVELLRKVRRDASGTIKLKADITKVDLPNKQVCYGNARVTDVSLSNTLGIGESVYRWVANRALPNGGCFDI